MHIVGVTTKFVKTTPNRGTRSPNAWARYIVSQCIEYRRTRTVLLPAGDEYGHLTTNQLCPQSTVVRAYAKAQGGHFRHKLCAPTHALNHLLPPTRNRASLRTRGHSYQLPEYTTDLHKKSFLIRSLYSFVKWNSFFGFAALYCTSFWLCFLCLLFDVHLSLYRTSFIGYCFKNYGDNVCELVGECPVNGTSSGTSGDF